MKTVYSWLLASLLLIPNLVFADSLYPGCTDPLACNFDPSATTDDGSCYYSAPNDVCTNATSVSTGMPILMSNTCSVLNGVNPGCWVEGVESDVWYSFVAPATGQIVIECYSDMASTLLDSQLALYASCGGPALYCDDDSGDGLHARISLDCSDLNAGNTYYVQVDGFNGATGNCIFIVDVVDILGCTDPMAVNYNACATVDDGSCTTEGCTDISACNYSPLALTDNGTCCYGTCVTLEIAAGVAPSEIGYSLMDTDGFEYVAASTPGAAPAEYTFCLQNGCYTFIMTDIFGDGWNGATYTFRDSDNNIIASGTFDNVPFYNAYMTTISFTLGGGSVGCTDAMACNYDPMASCDDGSCDFTSCYGCMDNTACNFNPDAIYDDGSCCNGGCVTLEMYDLSEDTWDDGYYIILDALGAEVAFGTMTDIAPSQTENFCLADGCYTFYVYGGNFPEEVAWLLDGINQGPIYGDGFGLTVYEFSIGSGSCFGCIEPTACNYNPFALYDDGSCINGPCVTGDNPWTAIPLVVNQNNACLPSSHTFAGATTTAISESAALTGEDIWYAFTALEPGIRIEVGSMLNDVIVELKDASYATITDRNLLAGAGGEVLNFAGLTPGEMYYIGVRNYDSAMGMNDYSICGRALKNSTCDYGPGLYNLCQVYKARYIGSGGSYRFEFTQTMAPFLTLTRTQTSDLLVLSNVTGLEYNRNYDIEITAIYNLTNSVGDIETFEIPTSSVCNMSIGAHPSAQVRLADRCVTGPKWRGGFISATPWVCGATGWTWELTQVSPDTGTPIASAINFTVNVPNSTLNLGAVPGLIPGAHYSVRTAPVIAGIPGTFGSAQTICLFSLSNAEMNADEMESALLGTTESSEESVNIAVYPNPNNGAGFYVEVGTLNEEKLQLTIMDAAGRIVFTENNIATSDGYQRLYIDQQFAAGMYVITVNGNQSHQAVRMIVQE